MGRTVIADGSPHVCVRDRWRGGVHNGRMGTYESWLEQASIDDAVRDLRPDYRAVLVVAEGLSGGESNEASETLLFAAEEHVRPLLEHTKVEELPHIAAWREAFRAFGAKPQRTRNSAEALMRRADALPRINALTDAYNAVSVRFQTPLGGENLAAYDGPLRLGRRDDRAPRARRGRLA